MDDDWLPPLPPRIYDVDDDGFYDHYYWDRQREKREKPKEGNAEDMV